MSSFESQDVVSHDRNAPINLHTQVVGSAGSILVNGTSTCIVCGCGGAKLRSTKKSMYVVYIHCVTLSTLRTIGTLVAGRFHWFPPQVLRVANSLGRLFNNVKGL